MERLKTHQIEFEKIARDEIHGYCIIYLLLNKNPIIISYYIHLLNTLK